MTRLVLASGNPDKTRELRDLLAGTGIEVIPIRALIPSWDVEETGATLEENALLKARAAAEATGLPAVADDTGLFVEVLGGAPGIYAARFAGEACSYQDNVRKLLGMMLGETDRRARFRTVVALRDPDGGEACFPGEVTGEIVRSPRGEGGFGYDPVFRADGMEGTFAQCSPEEKRAVSHRARAMQRFRESLSPVDGPSSSTP